MQNKRALQILCGLKTRESCRENFQRQGMFTLTSLLVCSVLDFVIHTPQLFQTPVHSYNTRNKSDLIVTKHRLTLLKKGVGPFQSYQKLYKG